MISQTCLIFPGASPVGLPAARPVAELGLAEDALGDAPAETVAESTAAIAKASTASNWNAPQPQWKQ